MNEANRIDNSMIIINYNSKANYNAENEIIYNTEVLKSNLCDYNDVIFVITAAPEILYQKSTI